jgi:gamma-glutamyltranspeptidase/glutathione hydrolase
MAVDDKLVCIAFRFGQEMLSIRLMFFRILLVLLATLWVLPAVAAAGTTAIASAHPLATRAGQETLLRGGNAFDAAVSIAAALAVVEPYSSGLGGGGFWLFHRASDHAEVVVDGRERAPLAATPDMYLGPDRAPRDRASLDGPLAAAIPGTPAALAWVSRKYGRLPLRVALEPAIRLARQGFTVDPRLATMIKARASALQRNPGAAAIFLPDGQPLREGMRLRQPQLAKVLEALGQHEAAGFYKGWVARELVRSVRNHGGIWSEMDLASYQIVERPPVRFTYQDATIVSTPLPSSGGLVLAEALNILERLPYSEATQAQRMHLAVEAMRRAYQDRARYMGDPSFVAVPVDRLVSKDYAAERAASIDPDNATPSDTLDEAAATVGGDNTTHFSIVDTDGNRAAVTLSINTLFGSGFVAGETGVILNNEMDDFVSAPGLANTYGLEGGAANAIAPGKRPLSSMSPTFVENKRGVLIVGTPGGARIISMVLLAILDFIHEPLLSVKEIVAKPRYHHQYLPDRVEVEPGGFPGEVLQDLELKGHLVQEVTHPWGNMQAIFIDRRSGAAVPASDPRGLAGGMAWY